MPKTQTLYDAGLHCAGTLASCQDMIYDKTASGTTSGAGYTDAFNHQDMCAGGCCWSAVLLVVRPLRWPLGNQVEKAEERRPST